MTFGPLRPGEPDFPAVNPTPSDPQVTGYIPPGSVTNAAIGFGIDPRKIQLIGAKVYRSTTQAITTGSTGAVITFDTEVYDAGNFWAVGAPTRLVIPYSGIYNIGAYAEFANAAAGDVRRVRIDKNGSSIVGFTNSPIQGGNPTPMFVPITQRLTAGDYLELRVNHDRGSDCNINSGEGNNFFAITFLGSI